MADYIGEIFHRLRDIDYTDVVKSRIKFADIGFRNQQAVTKLSSALIKIIYPNKVLTKQELVEVVNIAIGLRKLVLDQLAIISPGEFSNTSIKYEVLDV
jgi:predicted ATP-dependent Lon-type protease